MKKLIALALSAAILFPTAAGARDWDHDGDRDGHHHFRRDFRFNNFGYRSFGYYPRVRTVISVGYPYGYSPYGYAYPYGYGYPYGYAYPNAYGYPAYAYGYGYPGYGYGSYGCGNPAAGAVAGGLAGAVIGSAVSDRDRIHRTRFGYRYRRGNGAAGAIIGGVLGAAVGGAVASGNCY
jgi:hypothetical protein